MTNKSEPSPPAVIEAAPLDALVLDAVLRRALAEDLGLDPDVSHDSAALLARDVTTRTAVPAGARARARLIAKADGVVCGLAALGRAAELLDPESEYEIFVPDGARIAPGDLIAEVRGKARALLVAERTALNLIQRLSGVATRAAECAAAVRGTGARVLDTRKTTPGLRALEKGAVRIGGAHNHRFGLFDEAMVKENHIELAGRTIEDVLADLRAELGPRVPITCEARNEREARAAVRGGADVVLLDNMTPNELARLAPALRALAAEGGREVELEASGGITLATLGRFAASGVDRISMGALTHSAPALDLSLELEPLSDPLARPRAGEARERKAT